MNPVPALGHELKTWPAEFADVASGAKRVELRYNDRGYRVGDMLLLREYDPHRRPRRPAGGDRQVHRSLLRSLGDSCSTRRSVGVVAGLGSAVAGGDAAGRGRVVGVTRIGSHGREGGSVSIPDKGAALGRRNQQQTTRRTTRRSGGRSCSAWTRRRGRKSSSPLSNTPLRVDMEKLT